MSRMLFIADPQTTDQEGTILLTADNTAHTYTVAFESGVMVFMNGDNDLESFAIDDFLEMSRVGNSCGQLMCLRQFEKMPIDAMKRRRRVSAR
jgi:hypothetical protein